MKTNRLLMVLVFLAMLLLAACSSAARVGELQTDSHSVDLGDAESVRVEIKMGAGNLEVTGGGEKLLESDFVYNVAQLKPDVSYIEGSLIIRQPDTHGLPALQGITEFHNEWSLQLSDKVPMDLSVDLGAGSGNLELAGLSLTVLDVSLGAGEYMIDLRGDWARGLDVTMETGAANVILKLPGDVGVRVQIEAGPNIVSAKGLTQNGNIYTNSAYGMSDVTMQIDMEPGIGQIFLEVEEPARPNVELQTLLDQEVEKQDIPGMVMAARLADGTVIWATSGYTSPSGNERWSANTPSLIASVTKTFTAVVVLQLMEEEKLSLNDTVDTWVPEQPNGDEITIRMLVSHTSGLAEYSSTFGTDLDKWSRDWTPEELIGEANKVGPIGVPGSSAAHYSNTNYIMLGRIVEKVTGNSWEEEIESRIIKPLGLEHTTFTSELKDNGDVVSGYMKTSDGYLSVLEHPWYSPVSASTALATGGIVSSASDLMTFASALFDGKLVSNETLAIMTQPVATGDGRTWALGGGALEINGRTAFGMGGDTTGYHAFFVGLPDSRIVVAALVNTDGGDVISPSLAALRYITQPNQK